MAGSRSRREGTLASCFVKNFVAAASALEEHAPLRPTSKAWTAHMWNVLRRTSQRLGLVPEYRTTEDSSTAQEYLWDWTFYKHQGLYGAPVVALEHENSWGAAEFRRDFWKVLAAGAPLRVMIGYVGGTTAMQNRIERDIPRVAGEFGTVAFGEDLVILRNGREAADANAFWRILWRGARQHEFTRFNAVG
jgi:hypothetical protein